MRIHNVLQKNQRKLYSNILCWKIGNLSFLVEQWNDYDHILNQKTTQILPRPSNQKVAID